jgi:hypothetical protein
MREDAPAFSTHAQFCRVPPRLFRGTLTSLRLTLILQTLELLSLIAFFLFLLRPSPSLHFLSQPFHLPGRRFQLRDLPLIEMFQTFATNHFPVSRLHPPPVFFDRDGSLFWGHEEAMAAAALERIPIRCLPDSFTPAPGAPTTKSGAARTINHFPGHV